MTQNTFHTGDCSTDCEFCSFLCARDNHTNCLGSPAERARADALVNEKLKSIDGLEYNG